MTPPSERALEWARKEHGHRWDHGECLCVSCLDLSRALDAFAAEAVRAEREALIKIARKRQEVFVGTTEQQGFSAWERVIDMICARTPAPGEEGK